MIHSLLASSGCFPQEVIDCQSSQSKPKFAWASASNILSESAQQHFLWASDLHRVVRRQQKSKSVIVDDKRCIFPLIRVRQTGPGDSLNASANPRECEGVAAGLPFRPGFPGGLSSNGTVGFEPPNPGADGSFVRRTQDRIKR